MLLGLMGTVGDYRGQLGFIGVRLERLPALLPGRRTELLGVVERMEAAGFLLRRWLPPRLRGGRG